MEKLKKYKWWLFLGVILLVVGGKTYEKLDRNFVGVYKESGSYKVYVEPKYTVDGKMVICLDDMEELIDKDWVIKPGNVLGYSKLNEADARKK